MKAIVIGFKPNDLGEGLAVLNNLAGALGEELEANALIISKEPFKHGGFHKIYYVKTASLYNSIGSIYKVLEGLTVDTVVSPNIKDGVDLLGRVATKIDGYMITEVSSIEKIDGDVYLARPILGGRATAYYRYSPGTLFTYTVGKFQLIDVAGEPDVIEVTPEPGSYTVVGVEEKKRGAVDIESAEVVVGVGRGFRNKDDIRMASELAELLGGEVGCSRPIAADFGWLDEDRWIGISGKKIRPKLYIPIGISGAPQHIMAANDSKVIIAVNKDKNAPIFNYSDYGVVADLYQFLPVFIKVLRERLAK